MARLVATYRLQLHRGFGLRDAARVAPYLAQLGVSHLYLSPVFRARRGSTHGYDVVDPAAVNPELGTERDLGRLAGALRRRGMGLLLDIVPNHMAVGRENPYWDDVLARGLASRYARWFDVDWRAERGSPRVVLPVLGDEPAAVVRRGELHLVWRRGGYRVEYGEHSFPLDQARLPDELRVHGARAARAAAARFERRAGASGWGGLLAAQHYRLVFWRRAARELNYRRFFTISDLVALRAEDPEVFRATHALVGAWVARGWIDALRVDHIDGLLDPRTYLERLSRALPGGRRVPVYVEKILARGERLPAAWCTAGTTGYDFLAEAGDLFVSPAGHAALERGYRRLTGRRDDFRAVVHWAKRKLLRVHLVAERRRLGRRLRAALGPGQGPPAAALAQAVSETIVHLDVYRTYVDERPGSPSAQDRAVLDGALRGARRAGRSDPAALAALRRVLLLRGPRDVGAVQQFQQLCVAVAAKGVEDTAMYAHVALASRNEVGATPDAPLVGAPAALHAANAARARRWPAALLAVATHDTKRSADVRARLDVLSEIPVEWLRCVRRWRRWHRPCGRTVGGRAAPSASAEYLLYQTMVAIWPSGAPARGTADLRARIEAYALKAVRETKRRTSWIRPDADYEAAVTAFVRAVLAPGNRRFLDELNALVARVAPAGRWNALARLLVQVTAPGVPDVYQGDELWNLALVDPDNRRPVDFERRRRALASLRGAGIDELVAAPEDGRLKLLVLARALAARRRAPALFAGGAYRPLAAGGGPAAPHLFAFARHAGRRWAVTVVPRLTLSLGVAPGLPPCGSVWGGVHVALPPALRGVRLVSALTGERFRVPSRGAVRLPAAAVLGRLPVALLVGRGG